MASTIAHPTHQQRLSSISISRRDLLATAGIIAAGVLITTGDGISTNAAPSLDNCIDLLRGKPGTEAIANHYLATFPEHRNPQTLLAITRDTLGATGQSLATLIKHDFSCNRMLVINEWPLSVTEARLCTLACMPNIA